jgi:hypothetical protein
MKSTQPHKFFISIIKNYTVFRIIFFTALLWLLPTIIFSQSTLEKIKKLELQTKEGEIVQYFSEGCSQKAEALKSLLGNSMAYYEKTFGIVESYSIAVLESHDWELITEIPYGLPFVSGPPYIIVLPSSSNNMLAQLIEKSIAGYDLDKKYSKTNEELASIFISMIGFHELGHIYAKKYGLKFPNKWTFEFAATYFAYLYIADNGGSVGEIWYSIGEILAEEINPKYTQLNHFEKLYFNVGIESYAWYQSVFLLRTKEVQNSLGSEFVRRLLGTSLSEADNNFSLEKLEGVDPGFMDWAYKYKLIK